MDTAKLLATFSAGIAATIVGTALQVGDKPRGLDVAASIVLGASFLAVLAVVLLDRIGEADTGETLQLAKVHSWKEEKLVEELRAANIKAVQGNADVIRTVQWALAIQIVLSVSAFVLASISLLT